MSPEVICISSSSPAQIFARSPTPVLWESPLHREISPLDSSPPPAPVVWSFGTPPVSRSQQPRKTRKLSPVGKQTGNVEDNGTGLSGRIGQENLPLSSSRKDAAKKKKVTSRKSSEPNPRKAVTKPATTESAPSKTAPKGNNPRARKSRIVDKLSNGTLGATITKPGAGSAPRVTEKPSRKTQALSPADPAESCNDSFTWEPGCLELDEAPGRKLQWTPPKHAPTPILNLTNDNGDNDNDVLSESETRFSSTNQSFGKLFSTFGFNKQPQEHRDNIRQTDGGAPTKKRRLELVDKSVSTSRLQTPSTEDQANSDGTSKGIGKSKRGQKKLTTITAYATASYLNDDGEKEGSVDQYLPQIQTDKREDTKRKRGSKQQTSKPRQSRKTEQGQKKKGSNPDFEILPPEKAFKSFADQELLFGTLSQLERDESPTLIRDTQLALKNSESCVTSVSVETPEPSQGNRSLCPSSSRAGSVTSRLVGSRNLWSIAARDFDGSLTKAEVIDLVDTPKASEVLAKIGPLSNYNEEWLDIDATPDTPSKDIGLPDQEQVYSINDVNVTDANSNEEEDDQSPAVSNENARDPALPEKPIFGGYSTADLAKQVAKYGFKAIKNRDRMVALLEKCWESKYETPSTVMQDTRPSPALTSEEPISGGSKDQGRGWGCDKSVGSTEAKRPRATNVKTSSSATTQDKNKIRPSRADGPLLSKEDNEAANTNKESTYLSKQSPPNASSLSSIRAPSLAAAKAPSSKAFTAATKNRKSLPDLSLRIKSAIESQPPISSNSGRKQLTWHEKILMYDPIVMEDLATWLNTEGLDRIGEDREVSAGFVREWCENEGICCCWKKGLDMPGGSRGAWK